MNELLGSKEFSPRVCGLLWTCHGLLLAVGVTTAAAHIQEQRSALLPPLRTRPLAVEPLYDYPVVVTDQQLQAVLSKLAPRDLGSQTKINHVDHALRFWGAEAEFAHPGTLSGRAMRELLTDDQRFVDRYGTEMNPLLIDTGDGVRVEVSRGIGSSSHVDHTVAGLAEVGTSLDFPVRTQERTTTFRAMVEQVLRDFSLNQAEYEWSAVTFALFVASDAEWTTIEGQRMTFDRIAARLMRQEMPQGVCFGNHRLHALVVLLRVDEQESILSPGRRQEVIEYLQGMTRRLVQTQHERGFWSGNWPIAMADDRPFDREGDHLADQIIATGHVLEWWALAPSELHPPRHVLAAAGQWLARTVEEMSAEDVQANYTFLTHAGRSLALWRGVHPADVELDVDAETRASASAKGGLQLSAKTYGGTPAGR